MRFEEEVAKAALSSVAPIVEKKPKSKKTSVKEDLLDMVIAFDSTGSMSSYIVDVKKYVKDLIPKLLKDNPNLNLGIVVFGDYCDMINKDNFGKAYQVIKPTRDQTHLIDFVTHAENTAGGDADEFYELVIKKIVEETPWREDSEKAVLLIGDASPHGTRYSFKDYVKESIDWVLEAKKAGDKGIKFDTLIINPRSIAAGFYNKLSEMTNGVALPFKNSEKTSQLVEAAALSRGGSTTRGLFKSAMESVKDDVEMTAVYSTYSKVIK